MKELIQQLMESIKVATIANQQELGIRSSGESAQSLSAVADEVSGELSGSHYFYQQIHGRKPGKFPPIQNMLDWIQRKGITPRDEKTTLAQLAYLFARKIAQSGTDIFQGKAPALAFLEIINENVGEFQKELADQEANALADQMASILNNAFNPTTS